MGIGGLPDRVGSRAATHLWIEQWVGDNPYAHGLAEDLFDIIDANDEIQDYVSRRGDWVEPELLKLLADLDHLIASRE